MSDDKECYIEYKHYDEVIRFSGLNRDMNMEDFHDLCKRLAHAVGYSDKVITEWFDQFEEHMEVMDILERKISSLEIALKNKTLDAERLGLENIRLNGIVHGMYT